MLDKTVARLVSLVYFIQGALGITGIALPLYLKSLGFSISQIAALASASAFPWFLKIIYGALSDSFPILGLRRKPYIFLSSLLAAAGWLALALKPSGFASLFLILSAVNLGFAATDVITDGLIVEKSDGKTVGQYQSLAWGVRSVGAIVSGVAGGYLAQILPYHKVFAIAAILPLITMLYALSVREEKDGPKEGFIWEPIWRSIKLLASQERLSFSLILVIVAFSASFSTPYFFYLKEKIGLSEKSLGFLASLSWSGAVVGAFIFGKFLSKISLVKMMIFGVLVNLASTLACLWVFNFTSAAVIFSVSGLLGYLTFLPLLSAAAKLSHGTGVEGSFFAVLMSIHNLGTVLSGIAGGALYSVIGLSNLILLTGFIGLAALPFILKLKSV